MTTTLDICTRIHEIDDAIRESTSDLLDERTRLEQELFALTGQTYDEFSDGMRRLLNGGMTIRVGDGPEMTVDEFLEEGR